MRRFKNTDFLVVLFILGLLFAFRMILTIQGSVPFNADEAVVGLMARHILEGERPIFFYGQAYMGSLDAFLIAAGFRIFGDSVMSIRVIQSLLYLFAAVMCFTVAKKALGEKSALFGLGLLAFGGVTLVLYTSATLGGYNEALLFGAAQMVMAVNMSQTHNPSRKMWLIFGIFAGAGFWANALTLVFTIPILLEFLFRAVKEKQFQRRFSYSIWLLFGAGFGALPWLFALVKSGWWPLLSELTGSAVAVEGGSFVTRLGLHLLNFVLFGLPVILGVRAPWSADWFALAAAPFLTLIWGLIGRWAIQNTKVEGARGFFYKTSLGTFSLLILLFLLTSFGADPSGRYFLPLIVLGSLWAGDWLSSGPLPLRLKILAYVLIIGVNIYGVFWATRPDRPGLTTQFYAPTIVDHSYDQELIHFLEQTGETRGYSTYWIAYPAVYHSQEKIILSPRLPYHLDLRYTPRDDRIPAYTDLVSRSSKPQVLVIQPNELLENRIRERLSALAIRWQEERIGDYLIFYQLSRKVDPADFGFPFP